MISYDIFLQEANTDDVKLMNLFAMGQRISTTDAAEADLYHAAIQRLFEAQVVTRAVQGWEWKSDTLWYTFDATVDPVAAGYLATAASERLTLSRLPLPTTP